MKVGLVRTDTDADFGKYRLLAGIGTGGMAEVFIAVASGPGGFNKLFVIKRLLPAMASDPNYRSMFVQEARLAARLNHPNVVQTYEVGEHDGIIYIAMEYLEGQPLSRLRRALAKDARRLHPTTCIRIASEALAGLHHAHELRDFDGTPLKVVHRDVSPQNVFITYSGQVKLLDFGIAKAERSSTKTQAGIVKGKYAYMAPEQFLDSPIDRRVDVFTMGTVLWELIAGHSLFAGGTDAQIINRLFHEPIPRLSTVTPDVSTKLDDILARALERDPEKRTATALEMKEALDEHLATIGGAREDLGRIVSTTFAEAREAIDGILTQNLGRATLASLEDVDELVSVSSIKTGTATVARSGTHRAVVVERSSSGTPVPLPAAQAMPSSVPPPPALATRKRVIAALVIAGGIAGGLVSRSLSKPSNVEASQPPPTVIVAPVPTPTPPPPPPPSAIPEPPKPEKDPPKPEPAKATPPPRWTPPPPPPKVTASTIASAASPQRSLRQSRRLRR